MTKSRDAIRQYLTGHHHNTTANPNAMSVSQSSLGSEDFTDRVTRRRVKTMMGHEMAN